MASSKNLLQIGNLVKYRMHVSFDWKVGLIIGLTDSLITLYIGDNKNGFGIIDIFKHHKASLQLLSRPYRKVG